MSDKRVALWYAVMLIPSVAASIACTLGLSMAGDSWLPRSQAPFYGVVLNTVPSVVIGAAVYFMLALGCGRRLSRRTSRHVYRAAPLYVTVIALGLFAGANWTNPGFGLVAQLFVWPLLALLAAIPMEAVAWRMSASA